MNVDKGIADSYARLNTVAVDVLKGERRFERALLCEVWYYERLTILQ